MKDKRLEKIISLIPKNSSLIDVGCDHGYVGLYIAKMGNKVLFTDIHEDALNKAKKNTLNEEINASFMCTDGLHNVDINSYETIVIAGMGYHTIKHILNPYINELRNKTIIIESNNDLDKLRIYLLGNNYKIEEHLVKERKKYYSIFKVENGSQTYTKEELFLGPLKKENKEYYKYLKQEYQNIANNIPKGNKKKIEILNKIEIINSFIKKTEEN